MEPYITVANFGEGQITEKHSKFIASVYPIKTESEAIDLINAAKRKYWDARHNVYAYILKDGTCRYTDDGEPSGTAGVPVLDTLKKQGIVDCLVIVTRYFGGTLLGTGGLVRAYTAAANEGIKNANIVKMVPSFICKIESEYGEYDKLTRILNDCTAKIINSEFLQSVETRFSINFEGYENLEQKVTDYFGGRLKITKREEKYEYF